MPQTKAAPPSDATPTLDPVAALRSRADALFRAAAECVRQHDRYARLVGHSVDDGEQRAALKIVRLADETLGECLGAYERAAGRSGAPRGTEWWHKANALWLAGREYIRRQAVCNKTARRVNEPCPDALGSLTLHYDLEASALLALRQAVDVYRKVRPEATLAKAS